MAFHRVQILGVLQFISIFHNSAINVDRVIDHSFSTSRVDCRIPDAVGVVHFYCLDGQREIPGCLLEDGGLSRPSDRQNAWRGALIFL
jgi:hypothetical protein